MDLGALCLKVDLGALCLLVHEALPLVGVLQASAKVFDAFHELGDFRTRGVRRGAVVDLLELHNGGDNSHKQISGRRS